MRALTFALVFLLLLSAVQARMVQFQYPSKQNDFCGIEIGRSYCKCAFHDEYCEAVGMDQAAARRKVDHEFRSWTAGSIEHFAWACMKRRGIWHRDDKTCEYCDAGEVREAGQCVTVKQPMEERYNLPEPPEPVPVRGGVQPVGHVNDVEGDVFIYSQGLEKWVGPVKRGRSVFEGDFIVTKDGRAELDYGGASRLRLAGRTQLQIPSKVEKEPRHWLVEGALHVWENIKRIARNEPLKMEGGHSIAGIKGTEFIAQVQADVDVYTVKEGLVDVAPKDAPSQSKTLRAGESASVAQRIRNQAYRWEELMTQYDFDYRTESLNKTLAEQPIDPDAIVPMEAAYTEDLVGTVDLPGTSWLTYLIVLLLAAAGYYYWKR